MTHPVSDNKHGKPARKLDVNGTVSATLFRGSGESLKKITEGQIPRLPISKMTGPVQCSARDVPNLGSGNVSKKFFECTRLHERERERTNKLSEGGLEKKKS
jgi:hypothetical protein